MSLNSRPLNYYSCLKTTLRVVLSAISWECVREDSGISVKCVSHFTFFAASLKIWNQGLFLKDRFFFVDFIFFQHEDFVSNTNTQKSKDGKKR